MSSITHTHRDMDVHMKECHLLDLILMTGSRNMDFRHMLIC